MLYSSYESFEISFVDIFLSICEASNFSVKESRQKLILMMRSPGYEKAMRQLNIIKDMNLTEREKDLCDDEFNRRVKENTLNDIDLIGTLRREREKEKERNHLAQQMKDW